VSIQEFFEYRTPVPVQLVFIVVLADVIFLCFFLLALLAFSAVAITTTLYKLKYSTPVNII